MQPADCEGEDAERRKQVVLEILRQGARGEGGATEENPGTRQSQMH